MEIEGLACAELEEDGAVDLLDSLRAWPGAHRLAALPRPGRKRVRGGWSAQGGGGGGEPPLAARTNRRP